MSFMLILNRLSKAMLVLVLVVSNPVFAQEPLKGEASQTLGLFYAVRDTDDKCGGLSAEERQTLEQLIAQGLETEQPRPEVREALEKGAFKDDIDCNDPRFITLYRMINKEDEDISSVGSEQSDDEPTDEALKLQLEQVISGLPPGKLSSLRGCWQGDLTGWRLKLCFSEGGDKAEMNLAQLNSSSTCRLDLGKARGREGGAFFYAFSSEHKCSDGRTIAHVEGICSGLETASMTCSISIYEHANKFFEVEDGGNEPLNGELQFTRQ